MLGRQFALTLALSFLSVSSVRFVGAMDPNTPTRNPSIKSSRQFMRKKLASHPYSCPTCRAQVELDTRIRSASIATERQYPLRIRHDDCLSVSLFRTLRRGVKHFSRPMRTRNPFWTVSCKTPNDWTAFSGTRINKKSKNTWIVFGRPNRECND